MGYLYLTRRIEAAKTPEERDKILQMIATHSPQSWAHINALGEYDFSDDLQGTRGIRVTTHVWMPASVQVIFERFECVIGCGHV